MSDKTITSSPQIIGIIGGGQLAMLLSQAAQKLGYKTHIFCPEANSPANHVADYVTNAQYNDEKALAAFCKAVDVVTLEFENIPVESLQYIEKHAILRPNSNSVFIAQNRLREKKFISKITNVANFHEVGDQAAFVKAVEGFGGRGILKIAENGYDGKGQFVIKQGDDLAAIWQKAAETKLPKVLEEFINYQKEISIIAARSSVGEVLCYDAIENHHESGILRQSKVPALISEGLNRNAQEIAVKIANALDFVGVLTIEFFVRDGQLIVNEIAPRVHNSGHLTIEACKASQFEQAIRAICGMEFGDSAFIHKAEMFNLIGDEISQIAELRTQAGVVAYDYGKRDARPNRKMGHYVKI